MNRDNRRRRLTPSLVLSLEPEDQAIEYSDTIRTGLRLKVTPNGARVFLFAYRRPDDGLSAKYRIGTVDQVTLAQARAKAKQLSADVTNGIDPQRRKVDARRHGESPTVTAMAELWIRTMAREWRAATLAEKKHYVYQEIKPHVGHVDPRKIEVLDLRRLLMRLRHGVKGSEGTWVRKPAPVCANRLHSCLRSLFAWARENGHVEANPMDAIGRPYDGEVERSVFFTDDQVRRIFAALEHETETVRDFFTLTAYCGTRNSEARLMRWNEVDFDQALWTIPAASHKTGALAKDRPVPLSEPALALLRRRHDALSTVTSMYVFPRSDDPGRPLQPIGDVLIRVRERAGIDDGVLHDFRRLMRDHMQEAGVEAEVAERCLGHLPPKLARTYARPWPVARMREALDLWAATLTNILATATTGIDQARRSI